MMKINNAATRPVPTAQTTNEKVSTEKKTDLTVKQDGADAARVDADFEKFLAAFRSINATW